MSFPREHRQKLHSTNPIERLHAEVKRRTNVGYLWDSLDDGRARFTPHGAFRLPATREGAPARESMDEVLLIKGWDSLDDGRARFTPHGAFRLPATREGAPARESIEVRTLVVIDESAHPAQIDIRRDDGVTRALVRATTQTQGAIQ